MCKRLINQQNQIKLSIHSLSLLSSQTVQKSKDFTERLYTSFIIFQISILYSNTKICLIYYLHWLVVFIVILCFVYLLNIFLIISPVARPLIRYRIHNSVYILPNVEPYATRIMDFHGNQAHFLIQRYCKCLGILFCILRYI